MAEDITIYTQAGDGRVWTTGGSNWSTMRNQSTGDGVSYGGATETLYCDKSGGLYNLGRLIYPFDLSALAGATINSATLKYTPSSIANNDGISLAFVQATPASLTTLVNGDYDCFGATEFGSRKTLASMSADSEVTITLNASAITAIQNAIGGNFGIMMRSNKDIDNSAPANLNRISIYMSEQASTKRPTLNINYEPAKSGGCLFYQQI